VCAYSLREGLIKALGTAVSASYSGDITSGAPSVLLGSPLVESDEAPSTQTTTVRDNEIVVGDFSQYVIVDKPGSTSLDFIPNLFNTSNNLPDGRRGWYMRFRSGADVTNALAFRLLQDKTSA
jgi:HK97 family phage major capsid protein